MWQIFGWNTADLHRTLVDRSEVYLNSIVCIYYLLHNLYNNNINLKFGEDVVNDRMKGENVNLYQLSPIERDTHLMPIVNLISETFRQAKNHAMNQEDLIRNVGERANCTDGAVLLALARVGIKDLDNGLIGPREPMAS